MQAAVAAETIDSGGGGRGGGLEKGKEGKHKDHRSADVQSHKLRCYQL